MLLLQHGASADAATKEMYTALHVAAKEGQEEVKKFLSRKISDALIINYLLERLHERKECLEILH
jgi:ankyrin repeat protein